MWEFIKKMVQAATVDTNGRPNTKKWTQYSVDDSGFTERLPNGNPGEEQHLWSDVLHVGILTTDDGPWLDDVFFVIKTKTGDMCITSEDAHEMCLFKHFEKLPGFQYEMAIRAMATCTNASFACWDVNWTSHAA